MKNIRKQYEKIYVTATILTGGLSGLLFLFPEDALAVDSTTLTTVVKRISGFAVWSAIVVMTGLGLVAVGGGIAKMWNSDRPEEKRKGMHQIGWGCVALFFAIVVVAVKKYVLQGDDTISARDLTSPLQAGPEDIFN